MRENHFLHKEKGGNEREGEWSKLGPTRVLTFSPKTLKPFLLEMA